MSERRPLRSVTEIDRYNVNVWEVYASRTFRYPRDNDRIPSIGGEMVRTASELANT